MARVAGEEVPPLAVFRPAVDAGTSASSPPRFPAYLSDRADAENFESAGVERDGFQAARHAVQDLRAQHGTAVVNRRQQHGLPGLKEARERDRAAASSRKIRSSGTCWLSFWSIPTPRSAPGSAGFSWNPACSTTAVPGLAGPAARMRRNR